jgi:O-antigen ligase
MNWKKCLSVSLFLFATSTLVSQSAMDGFAVLSIFFLIGFWLQTHRGFPLFPRLGVEKAFLAFAVAVVLSFLMNWNTQVLAFKRIIELKWILNFYFLASALLLFVPSWKPFQKLQWLVGFSAAFALLSPILGYDLLQGTDAIIDRTPSGVARVGGFFSNPMTFAHLHALYFFLLAGLTLKFFEASFKASLKDRLISLALTSLVGLALLLTFTRGVWAGIFVGLVAIGFILNRRWGLVILMASIIAGLSGFLLIPSVQERALQFLSSSSYDSERLWIWKANWQIFLDHPLFGIGYGENTLALQSYYDKIGAPSGLIISHSHNQYLHILAGLGLFGLAAYLWMMISLFRETWRTYVLRKSTNSPIWIQGLLLGALGAQISFFVGGITESNFEHSKVRYALMLVWSLAFWFRKEHFLKQDVKNV